jgi:hypothetical protein
LQSELKAELKSLYQVARAALGKRAS